MNYNVTSKDVYELLSSNNELHDIYRNIEIFNINNDYKIEV